MPDVPFTLLPAVDVAGGRAVRLAGGDPTDVARRWQAAGAAWIHLVDLDAAFGRGSNRDQLADLIAELDVHVELAGGIRDDASLAWALSTGCTRVVMATSAVDDPAWCARVVGAHGERIAVGLDVHITEAPDGSVSHRLQARGSRGDHGDHGDLWETLARLDRAGCARYVVTDVSRDGRLAGPDPAFYRAVARATPAKVIASGGISTIDDLIALAGAAEAGRQPRGSDRRPCPPHRPVHPARRARCATSRRYGNQPCRSTTRWLRVRANRHT